jgi:hypothetical protein
MEWAACQAKTSFGSTWDMVIADRMCAQIGPHSTATTRAVENKRVQGGQVVQRHVLYLLGLTTRQVCRLARRCNVRGFWAYIGYREAQNPTRDRFGQGDRTSAAGRYGPLDPAQAPD